MKCLVCRCGCALRSTQIDFKVNDDLVVHGVPVRQCAHVATNCTFCVMENTVVQRLLEILSARGAETELQYS